MSSLNETGTISPEQYTTYAAAWSSLINSGDQNTLNQAFELPEAARLNFLTFSIDQIIDLVSIPSAHLIKARFLYVPDMQRFSATLFATDVDNHCVSAYYVPTQFEGATRVLDAATATPTPESTEIPLDEAFSWLTAWVEKPSLQFSYFTVPPQPLHGYNFELSTFIDPLEAAQPYDSKALFLNLGLSVPPHAPESVELCNLVVYIDFIDNRQQGSIMGLPEEDIYYDRGVACPPASFF